MTSPRAGRIDSHASIDELDALVRSTLVAGDLALAERRLLAEALTMLADREQDLLLHAYLSVSPRQPPTFEVRVGGGSRAEPDASLTSTSTGLSATSAIRRAADLAAGGTAVDVIADDRTHGSWTMFTAGPGEPLELVFPPRGTNGAAGRWANRVLSWAESFESDPRPVVPTPASTKPIDWTSPGLVDELSAAVAARLAPMVASAVAEPVVELAAQIAELRALQDRIEAALDRLAQRTDPAAGPPAAPTPNSPTLY